MPTTQEKCFLLTSAFEGGGYATLSGNFDGAGCSFGFLQWNFGSGTLQPLLKAMAKADPTAFTKACTVAVASAPFNGATTDLSDDLLKVCDLSSAEAVKWIVQRQDSGHRLLPHWTVVFKNLAYLPQFQAVQRQFASPYWNRAVKYTQTYGFKSERGLALMFDICVQMGSVTAASNARYTATASGDEEAKLEAMARAVAPQAGRWASDVLSRKLTIALGKGIAHGRPYNLEKDYGITMAPVQ